LEKILSLRSLVTKYYVVTFKGYKSAK